MEKTNKPNLYPFDYEFTNFAGELVSGTVNLREPTPQELSLCTKKMTKDPVVAFKNMILPLVAESERESFKESVARYPGIATAIGGEIYKRTGFESLGN
ncbi:MAG: hypothetical protein HQL72_09085 [Magnetococcales bacterium]|nr:hypothetical protein [Magnetococcales bacterium]